MIERVYQLTRGEADAVLELLAHEKFGDDPRRRALFVQAIHVFETLGSDKPVRLILERIDGPQHLQPRLDWIEARSKRMSWFPSVPFMLPLGWMR